MVPCKSFADCATMGKLFTSVILHLLLVMGMLRHLIGEQYGAGHDDNAKSCPQSVSTVGQHPGTVRKAFLGKLAISA